jgi:L-malate glycosyltransferase
MRICYYADGRYIHAERWMKFFAERGYQMHLISFAQVSRERVDSLTRLGIRYHGSTGGFRVKRFWNTLADLRLVRSLVAREEIDLLHCHFLGANCWYAALSGFHPYIISIMGGGDVNGPEWKPGGNVQARLLTPYALRRADYVTSWSRSMAEVVRPLCGGTPIEVVHGGIHLERFHPGPRPAELSDRWNIPRDAKVVFSPRLMRPLSNILEFARAASLISQAMNNVYYVLAFPGTAVDEGYASAVEDALLAGAARDSYRLVSEIAHAEMADCFRFADVTVSIPVTDGTPMTVLESMACGTPTVIGNLPDYDREYFEDGATTTMVDVKDPRSIADGVIKVLSDRAFAERISLEAMRRVEETGGYEYQMSKMERIYKTLR